MEKGTILAANEMSNSRYGYTTKNNNCIVEFIDFDLLSKKHILVKILQCNYPKSVIGSLITLEREYFDIKPKHFISNYTIKSIIV